MVGYSEHGLLLHVDVADGAGQPITLTALTPPSELSWSQTRSAHDFEVGVWGIADQSEYTLTVARP